MSLVYRIETESGTGPYAIYVHWGQSEPYGPSHPGPLNDSGLADDWARLQDERVYTAYRFGFRDEAQLRAWFFDDEWMKAMKKAGLKLTVWEVEEGFAHYGYSQAVFNKSKARLVETRELI